MTDRELLLPYLTDERIERLRDALSRRRADVTVVLENLHKEHNTDAVLRTCEALGLQHVHVVPNPGRETPQRGITLGCHDWLTVHDHPDIESCYRRLRLDGYRIWVASLGTDSVDLREIRADGRIALVFANELSGATTAAMAGADGRFVIPLAGFSQSLNVSVAAGIALYHVLGVKSQTGQAPEPLPAGEQRDLMDRWVHRSVQNADAILAEVKGRRK